MIVVIYVEQSPKIVPRDFSEVNHFSFPSLWDLVLSHEDRNDGVSVPDMGRVRSVSGRLTDEATLVILSRDHSVIAVAKPLILAYGPFWRGFLARCIRELVSILDVNSPSLLCALPSCHLTMVPKFKRT